MTTLPQTTTVRVPQNAAAGVPGGAYPSAAAINAGGAFQMTGADVWRVIRANLWLIIILSLLGGTAGYLLYRAWPRSYTAVGALQIRTEILTDPVADKIRDMSDTRITTLARTQAEMLKSPNIMSEALKSPKIQNTGWYASLRKNYGDSFVEQAKKDLDKNFSAFSVPDTAIVRVSMTCGTAADAADVLQEIVDLHLKNERNRADTLVTKRSEALRLIRDGFRGEIDRLSASVRTTQETLAREGGGVEGMFSTLEAELRALMDARTKATLEYDEAKSGADHARDQIANGSMPLELQRVIENDGILNSLTLEQTRTIVEEAVKRETYGNEHKDIGRLTVATAEYDKKMNERRSTLRMKFEGPYLAGLESAAREKFDRIEKINKEIDTLKAKHASLSREKSQLELDKEMLRDQTQQRQLVVNVMSNLSASQTPDTLMPVSWAYEPQRPDMPSWPKLLIFVPAGVVLGLGLALGIGFLREFLDDTVRSPRDVVRVGQMNVLGMVADSDDDPQVASAKLPIFDAPHSLTAEQFRQIRTRLQHAAALDTTRSIMVTGPSAMDGKTTVAANLAAGLALNGRKTLLVDANFRRPEIHRFFSISNDKGFSDVLNGTSALEECVHATRIPNLSIMCSGPKPLNVTELFESQLLIDFIERALEEYDHVLFDSAPFLVVSESIAMASRVDGVVTVVRAHSESRGLLQRMRDALKQVRAEHIGVVLNAVRTQVGGYYGRNIKAYYTYNTKA